MAKGTIYYYFRLNLSGQPYAIKESMIYINTSIMRNFQAMTEGQIAFYRQHPDASIQEIVNCELTPPYVPPAQDVEDYKTYMITELENACYGSIKITSLEYAMAMDKVHNVTADSYYTLTQATQVLKEFRNQSKHAMEVRNDYKPQIEVATTIEAIDVIYNEAISKL